MFWSPVILELHHYIDEKTSTKSSFYITRFTFNNSLPFSTSKFRFLRLHFQPFNSTIFNTFQTTRKMETSNSDVPQKFVNIMVGASFVSVSSPACTSLITVRTVKNVAIQIVMATFKWDFIGSEGNHTRRVVSGAVVVPLKKTTRTFFEVFFFQSPASQKLSCIRECGTLRDGTA